MNNGANKNETRPAITDKEYAAESRLLEGVPRVNVGALLIPPIWGPAHGIWATIVFYPLWIVADTCFVNAIAYRSALAIIVGVAVFVLLSAATVAFAIISQPFALHRALEMGISKERYLKRQKAWAVAGIVVGGIAIAAATYYNLFMNPDLASVFGG